MALSKRAIEIAGRNWLTSQLVARGYNVATPEIDEGIDLIVFREIGASGIEVLPLQLKCALAETFTLNRKYAGRGIPLAYVWNVLGQAECYFLEYEEALQALGDKAVVTVSWIERGEYTMTSIPANLRERLAPFKDRWDWVEQRLRSGRVEDVSSS